MKRVTPGIGDAFGPVEKALRETFVPELFKVLGDGVLEKGVTCLPVKHEILALPDPTPTSPENCTASCVITGHLVGELRIQVEFHTADHLSCLREGRAVVRRRSQHQAEEALAATLEGAQVQCIRRLRRATKTGAWMTVQPSTINGMELGAQEWRDALFLRYGL